MKNTCLGILLVVLLACTSGGQIARDAVELKRFPLNNLEQVRAKTGVAFDPNVSADGKGSLRVDASGPMTVPLFEVTDVSIENATLLYQASLKSQGLEGKAYLEMWLRFPGKGEFFSRGLDRTLTGDMNWTTMTIPFFLKAGEKPDLIRLNLVVNGKGRVWIDDIQLLRQPLPAQ